MRRRLALLAALLAGVAPLAAMARATAAAGGEGALAAAGGGALGDADATATVLSAASRVASAPVKTQKPLIGILAQGCHDCPGRSYIATAFARWVELAGARPVPIFYYDSDAELRRLFNSVHGIVLPGGLTDLDHQHPYVVAAKKLWNWAREANDNGDVFPIHGTCLGFQLLHLLEASEALGRNVTYEELLVDTDSVAHPSALDFSSASPEELAASRMFGGMPARLLRELADPAAAIAMENHVYGLPPAHYVEYGLRRSFAALATARDRGGVEYVASAEHRRYPFTATQWHPEKPPFEFGMAEVPHAPAAVRVAQHLANAFVDAARRSGHAAASPEEEVAMQIYNTPPTFTLRDAEGDFEYDGPDQCYFFGQRTEPNSGADGASRSFRGARFVPARAH